MRRYLIALSFLLCLAGSMQAQTVTQLLHSGSSGSKKDLVIIGDGFQSGADQTTYNTFVNSWVIKGVFGEGPMWESANAFNIYRINVNSTDSGVTHVDSSGNVTTSRNTALDYRYSGSWDRCWMEGGPNTSTKLNSILSSLTPGWDYVFIILNESGYGGCAGGKQLAVTSGSSFYVGAHEMGHMVGNLADEYCGKGTYAGSEPSTVNITTNTTKSTLKWRAFVKTSTPIPTGTNSSPGNGSCTGYTAGSGAPSGWSSDGDAGVFEGAQYKDDGIYRPVVSCRMRSNSPPYCPVCYNKIKENLDPFQDYTYKESYSGDFTGDGRADVVIHNANSLALYESVGSELSPKWIATGAIPVWDEFKSGDRFYRADFNGDGKDDLFVVNFSDWAIPYFAMLKSTGSGFECVRRFDSELPGWDDMKSNDQFFVADFDGDGKDDIYVFNGKDWSTGYLEMLRSTGTNLEYVKRYDGSLPGWGEMKQNDRFYVADINHDKKKDLYIFNGNDWAVGYLQLLGSKATSLYNIKRYDDTLPGWDSMKAHDEFFAGDFNADGYDDLYVFNGQDWSSAYLEMLKSTGTAMANVKRFDGSVPGWDGLAEHDQFLVADVNGDKKADLYAYNSSDWATEYLGMLRSSGTNLSGSYQSNAISSWNLGAADKFLVGNFNGGSGGDDLMVRNSDWFGLLQSYQSSVQLSAIYPKWIHRHNYHYLGWW